MSIVHERCGGLAESSSCGLGAQVNQSAARGRYSANVMRMRALVFVGLAVGCAALPVRSVTGVRIKRITITESLALRAHQPPTIELSGVELEPAVSLLDRHGVLKLTQQEFTSLAEDGSSVSLDIELASSANVTFVLSNCPEPHVCGFLRDAVATGLLTRLPETCQKPLAPCDGSGCVPCSRPPVDQPLAAACTDLIDPSTCREYLQCQPVPDGDGGVTVMPGCRR